MTTTASAVNTQGEIPMGSTNRKVDDLDMYELISMTRTTLPTSNVVYVRSDVMERDDINFERLRDTMAERGITLVTGEPVDHDDGTRECVHCHQRKPLRAQYYQVTTLHGPVRYVPLCRACEGSSPSWIDAHVYQRWDRLDAAVQAVQQNPELDTRKEFKKRISGIAGSGYRPRGHRWSKRPNDE